LPISKTNIPCDISCSKGEYFDIDSQICIQCPENTYSLGGSFRVSGIQNEWIEDNLNKFENTCSYLALGISSDILKNCSKFGPNSENSSISAGYIEQTEYNAIYFYELTYRANIKKAGKVLLMKILD